jgi:diketogulonate reductase-like aldo/keto reductase
MCPRRTLLAAGVAVLTALHPAFGFSLASSARASERAPRGEDELQAARRRAVLTVLGTGVGAGLTRSAAAAGAPPRARGPQDAPASFRIPMEVGLGTCCPCDVQDAVVSEEEAVMGADAVCDATYQQVSEGLNAGYRFIDTATHYGNERSVGRALGDAVAAGIVSRADVLVCTKVWFDDLGYTSTLKSVAASNERLSADVGGADVVLIHFPGPNDSVQSPAKNKRLRQESWKALEQLRSEGRVKAIGVSNYVRRHMKELLAGCAVKPDVVELEIHPFNQQPELVALCRSNGIQVIGFSPLAHGDLPVLTNSLLVGIAADHGKSVPQVVLRWMLQENIVSALARPLHLHKQHHLSPCS